MWCYGSDVPQDRKPKQKKPVTRLGRLSLAPLPLAKALEGALKTPPPKVEEKAKRPRKKR